MAAIGIANWSQMYRTDWRKVSSADLDAVGEAGGHWWVAGATE